MDKIKEYFQTKSYGFYVSIALFILSLVTAIVYANVYGKYVAYMSWGGFAAMLIGCGAALLLTVLKLHNFAPAALALGNLVGLLLFIKYIYGYVAVVLVGIDLDSFSSQFIVCTVLFALCAVIGAANVFFKQVKEEK